MQPGETDLGFRSGPASDDNAGITGKSHEEIAGISHSTRNENGARPVFQTNLIGRNYAHDHTARLESTLSGNPRGWTSAATYNGNALRRQQSPGGRGQIVCSRARLGAA
jgi:hypothetical protein